MVEEKLVQIRKLKNCTGKELYFIAHDIPNTFSINCFIIGFEIRSQTITKKLN